VCSSLSALCSTALQRQPASQPANEPIQRMFLVGQARLALSGKWRRGRCRGVWVIMSDCLTHYTRLERNHGEQLLGRSWLAHLQSGCGTWDEVETRGNMVARSPRASRPAGNAHEVPTKTSARRSESGAAPARGSVSMTAALTARSAASCARWPALARRGRAVAGRRVDRENDRELVGDDVDARAASKLGRSVVHPLLVACGLDGGRSENEPERARDTHLASRAPSSPRRAIAPHRGTAVGAARLLAHCSLLLDSDGCGEAAGCM
jgi:hypothetical protein